MTDPGIVKQLADKAGDRRRELLEGGFDISFRQVVSRTVSKAVRDGLVRRERSGEYFRDVLREAGRRGGEQTVARRNVRAIFKRHI